MTLTDSNIYFGLAEYTISVSDGFTYSELSPSKKYYYFGYPIQTLTGLRTIEIHDSVLNSNLSPCTPSLTGVSNPELITFTHCDNGALCIQSGSFTSLTSAENLPSPASFNDTSLSSPSQGITPTAVWGRVDFRDRYAGEGGTLDYDGEIPLCGGPTSANAVYAFCSQKGDKTVLICISQMTDNEKLAKEIFETFRWTSP